MPEDAHPPLAPGCADNYHYFTLSMALNYQRDSYSMWRAATRTYEDALTRFVFDPAAVVRVPEEELRDALRKYGLATQPMKHTATWRTLCSTFCELWKGDVRELFRQTQRSVPAIKELVQKVHKKQVPYLCGPKICNYWLYVMGSYTEAPLAGREHLTIAPDTHVIQATIALGLVNPECRDTPGAQSTVAAAWQDVLAGTEFVPIDLHTPLWLWSRSGLHPLARKPESGSH